METVKTLPTELTEYDEYVVRKLVEQVVVTDEGFDITLKNGTSKSISIAVEDIDICIDEQTECCVRRLKNMDADDEAEVRNEAIEKIIGKKEEIREQLIEAKKTTA